MWQYTGLRNGPLPVYFNEAFPPQGPTHGLIKQLISICNMHQNTVNDLAEAMKALDEKKQMWHFR